MSRTPSNPLKLVFLLPFFCGLLPGCGGGPAGDAATAATDAAKTAVVGAQKAAPTNGAAAKTGASKTGGAQVNSSSKSWDTVGNANVDDSTPAPNH